MMVWHEMQRRIGEDEVNLIVWLPCFDVLLYESGGGDAGTRDSEHIVGQIKADDRRARKGRGQQLGAVSWTTAKVENPIRLELRNLNEKITRRARALVMIFGIRDRTLSFLRGE
jgi:hypothetical protein